MSWLAARLSYRRTTHIIRAPLLRPRSYASHSAASNLTVANILALSPLEPHATPRPVVATGHIRTIRNQKHRSFVEIGDGSSIQSLQALLDPSQATHLCPGTAVTLSGLWQPSPHGKEQAYELHAEQVEIVGATRPETYPIQKKYHSPEFLRTIPHLRLRTPFNGLLARLRSDCDFYVSTFFRNRDFVRMQPPIITSSDCEGAGEVFSLHTDHDRLAEHQGDEQPGTRSESFFRGSKYLTVSSQLHLEAFVHEHPRVWTLAPTFRAEKSDTPRHLSEFSMLEAEIQTVSLANVMDLVEALIRHIAVHVRDSKVGEELLAIQHGTGSTAGESQSRPEALQRRWQGLRRSLWPRISYREAIQLLRTAANADAAVFQYPPDWGLGLQLEHEKFIAAEVGQGSPVFVVDYPGAVKPFYMLPSTVEAPGDGDAGPTVACFDLLLPESCEVAGGSLREHRLPNLEQSMDKQGLRRSAADVGSPSDPNGLEWYLDLRRYGSVPHGGFGLGFDRLLGYLAGVDNVRDIVPWPRYYGKCDG